MKKVEYPKWMWPLCIFTLGCCVLRLVFLFNNWDLPMWADAFLYLEPILSGVAYWIWSCKPGGVWDQYEARQKKAQEEADRRKQAQEAAMRKWHNP